MKDSYKPFHLPIMVDEIIRFLNIKNHGVYLDATTGEGGHTNALLEYNKSVRLICNDRDSIILENAKKRLINYNKRITYINVNFSNIDRYVEKNSVDGIIADLGISSYHFDKDNRGFSFSRDDNLDMRLDNNISLSAYDIVNSFEEKELADIIYKYGEERFSRRIAHNIIKYRKSKSIKTTKQLCDIVNESIPKKFQPKNINPATKTFQAMRIYINDELKHLEESIKTLINILKPRSRLCILTFHSLEDRIVKKKFRDLSGYMGNRNPYIENQTSEQIIKIITKKPIKPSEKEIKINPRSRSSKLRVAEKL